MVARKSIQDAGKEWNQITMEQEQHIQFARRASSIKYYKYADPDNKSSNNAETTENGAITLYQKIGKSFKTQTLY